MQFMNYQINDDFDVHARPALISCGSEIGKCFVYSLKVDDNYSLLIHSLKQDKVIKELKGGQAFIDFYMRDNSSKATLIYLQGASEDNAEIV